MSRRLALRICSLACCTLPWLSGPLCAADGDLDPSFSGGKIMQDWGPSQDLATALTPLAGGRLLVAGRSVFVGSCLDCPEAGASGAFIVRLTADGVPDPTFSGDGWEALSPDPSCLETRGEAVSVSKAAVVTVAGSCQSVITTLTAATFVARLTAAGLFDSNFGGGDGVSALLDLTPRRPHDIAISPSTGKIALAMAPPTDIAAGGLLGLTATGALDSGFATSGFLDLDLEEGTRIDAVQFQSDGRIVAAGTINANGAQIAGFLLARTLANGTLDPSYDGNGVKRVEFDRAPNAYDRAHALALSSGRLVVGGTALGGIGGGVVALVRTGNTQILHAGFELGTPDEWAEE